MKKRFILSVSFLPYLIVCSVNAEENFSNYKQYNLTKTNYNLETIAKPFDHPWALTFIDDKNLIVTEKGGGLFKVNIENGSKNPIKHNIEHITYD